MNLADKLVYPISHAMVCNGITYKEALVLALAGNPATIENGDDDYKRFNAEQSANVIRVRADAIIKEMEEQ